MVRTEEAPELGSKAETGRWEPAGQHCGQTLQKVPHRFQAAQHLQMRTHQSHAYPTTSTLDTVTADQIDRQHAFNEQVPTWR